MGGDCQLILTRRGKSEIAEGHRDTGCGGAWVHVQGIDSGHHAPATGHCISQFMAAVLIK